MSVEQFVTIISILWVLSALFDFVDYLYVWQLKDYRWQKILDFAKSSEGIQYWLSYPTFFRPFIGLVTFFVIIRFDIPYVQWILLFLLTGDVLYQIYRWKIKQRIRRPRITLRILLSIVFAFTIEGAALISADAWIYILILSSVRLYTTSIAVLIASVPFILLKRIIIFLATEKMKRLPHITSIGITGSYGKTTVKEFLSHILSGSYQVIKTPKHVNTDIGVAMFILKADFSKADFFVAEMGADHVGDITKLVSIVKPKIGILTAINEQHMALFGSIENIQKEKYQLLYSLPKDGLAVVNNDNPYCREFINRLTCKTVTFGIEEEFNPTALLKDISESKDGLHISGIVHGKERHIFTPIHGAHNALNLGPCALVADYLGMDLEVYKKQVSTLPQPKQALELYSFGEQAFIIDDSYNANPTGFNAALEYMAIFSSAYRRVVITRGMLELGAKSSDLHEKIAGSIAFIADELILISKDEEDAIKRGLVSDKYKTVLHVLTDREKLLAKVKELEKEQCVILLENRIPAATYNYIMKQVKPVE